MNRTFKALPLMLAVLVAALLSANPASAQSVSIVDAARKTSHKAKASLVITNDNLPKSMSDANGAVERPQTSSPSAEVGNATAGNSAKTDATKNTAAGTPSTAGAVQQTDEQRVKELHEQEAYLGGQIAAINAKIAAEDNEATKSVMQQVVVGYQQQLGNVQGQLSQLSTTAKEKAKQQ